jgi:cystathionine beta-synthase
LDQERLAVMVFPDAGARYLSKFYDNKWMRENGFLKLEFGEIVLGDLLISKAEKILYSATLGDSMHNVMDVMHRCAVSQMPVVGLDGTLVGLIDEVDLLNHLMEHEGHSHDDPVDGLVQHARAVFPPVATLDEGMPLLMEGYALLVVEAGKPVGILTKIDVLDYVAGKI